jgi:hypothetical protein
VFKYLQSMTRPPKVGPDPGGVSLHQLVSDAKLPISIHAINQFPEHVRLRLYRALVPPALLGQFDIKPISWNGPEGEPLVKLTMHDHPGLVRLEAWHIPITRDPFLTVELQDNAINGVDLNLLVLSDPESERYEVDFDTAGNPTMFGTLHRNLGEEIRAMQAGLAPGQVRSGLRASGQVFQQLEAFLTMMAHYAVFLEPLTYVSAWVFEQRGFAYVRGHKLMDTIHQEFLPGGRLHQALDGSTLFRQPDQWRSVRGRGWAIQDGILDVLGMRWNDIRMVKQVGRSAGVNTFPEAIY